MRSPPRLRAHCRPPRNPGRSARCASSSRSARVPASTFTAHPRLHESLPYKPADLVPLARVTNTLIALGVPTEIGVSTMKQLVEKTKTAPGKLN